jgi:hypothetical protein
VVHDRRRGARHRAHRLGPLGASAPSASQALWRCSVAKAQRNSRGPTPEWHAPPCRSTLVRVTRDRAKRVQDQASREGIAMQKSARFAICVRNAGVPASLELRKVYALSRMLQRPPRASSASWMSPARTISTRTLSSCRLRCRRRRSERLRSVRPNHTLDQPAARIQRWTGFHGPPLISSDVAFRYLSHGDVVTHAGGLAQRMSDLWAHRIDHTVAQDARRALSPSRALTLVHEGGTSCCLELFLRCGAVKTGRDYRRTSDRGSCLGVDPRIRRTGEHRHFDS